MNFRFKDTLTEIPWEASILFIGWMWLGWSVFGMTLVNMIYPSLYIYHFFVAGIYLLPVVIIGFKILNYRNVSGIPLFAASGFIGLWTILIHLKMNLGLNIGVYTVRNIEFFTTLVLVVILPVSFYIYARSIGCKKNIKLQFFPGFAATALLILLVSKLLDFYYQATFSFFGYYALLSSLLFYFLFFIGPVLGGVYIKEIMSKES
ncbi:hypothetical protein V7O61_14555 [Methanolobus sp. WCC1]